MAANSLQTVAALIVAGGVAVEVAGMEAAVGVAALEPCVEVDVSKFLKEFGKIGFAVDVAKVQSASVRLAVKIPLAVGPAAVAAFAGHCAGEVVVDERFAWGAAAEEVLT